jgi:DNA-binding Xre family transcriptional regulator
VGVSYLKLREMKRVNKIRNYMIHNATGITHDELAKINKDEYMTLQSIERILKYLSTVLNRQIKIEDILDFVDD